jgi:hypothetical protein
LVGPALYTAFVDVSTGRFASLSPLVFRGVNNVNNSLLFRIKFDSFNHWIGFRTLGKDLIKPGR